MKKNMFHLITLFNLSLLCGYAKSQESGCTSHTVMTGFDINWLMGDWYVIAWAAPIYVPQPQQITPFERWSCPMAIFERDDDIPTPIKYTFITTNEKLNKNDTRVWYGYVNYSSGQLNFQNAWTPAYKGIYTVMEMDVAVPIQYAFVHFCTFPDPDKGTEKASNSYMILTKTKPVSSDAVKTLINHSNTLHDLHFNEYCNC